MNLDNIKIFIEKISIVKSSLSLYRKKLLHSFRILSSLAQDKRFQSGRKIIIFTMMLIMLSSVTILAFIAVFTYLKFASDLNNKNAIMNKNNTGITLLDKYNQPFFTFYSAKNAYFIPLSDIPAEMQNAVITAEDRDFYIHPGFSIKSIIRSLYKDVTLGETAYGGSTITQQLVKNALLSSKKSILRKYQEIILAQEIERRYSKMEILEMYLNSVYFGEGAFGVQQAARTYFNKNAKDLNLSESALLAGILPAPSQYSPFLAGRNKAVLQRNKILREMLNLHMITPDKKNEAEQKKLSFIRSFDNINSSGSHFALMVRDQLVRKYGEEYVSRSGFRVKTTLDLSWQKYAEITLKRQIENLTSSNVTNGSVVVIDPKTGRVRVLVGSKNWFDNKFGKVNIANTPRSPGSSFKPVIYSYAIENRIITAASKLRDEPVTFLGNHKPVDYDRKWRGIVSVRRALANSLNVPAVEIMQKVGVPAGLEYAQKLGITTLKDFSGYGLSLVLGSGEVKLLELTNVYAVFANEGVKNEISLIETIVDKRGDTIFVNKLTPGRVMGSGTAYIISSILSDSQARAEVFGNVLNTSIPAAVKTGTGEDYKSAVTIGYTPGITVGVWLGNNDNSPMGSIAGSIGPAPVWKNLIEYFSGDKPAVGFNKPSSIVYSPVCIYNGIYASRIVNNYISKEYFIKGTQPEERYCYNHGYNADDGKYGTSAGDSDNRNRNDMNRQELDNLREASRKQVKEQLRQAGEDKQKPPVL